MFKTLQANIIYDGKIIGFLGEVHPLVTKNYGIGERTYLAVLDLPAILPFATFERKYHGIARFPAVSRDLSMVVPKNIQAAQLEKVIRQGGGAILEELSLFDIYEGEQVKAGYKSMAYSLVFRSKERTLEEADINAAMNAILRGFSDMGIELRQ